MNIQKTIFGTIAGFVGLFGLGYLIYIVLLSGMNASIATADAEGVMREYFPGIIAFEVLFALLVTMIFQKWAGIKTFNGGLKAGAWIGLLIGLCVSLWMYSTTTLVTGDIIWWYALTFAIRFAVAGGLIGWVLGRE